MVFFSFLLFEKKKMPKENFWNTRVEVEWQKQEPKVRGQNKSLKESSLPSLHFFLLYGFLLFSFVWKEEDAKRKLLKQKGRSGMAEARAKSEREEQELEGKLLPFSAFLFFSMVFFYFLSLEKKKMPKENVWNKRVEAGAKSERAKHEFEGKLPPFSWFSFVNFLCVLSSLC